VSGERTPLVLVVLVVALLVLVVVGAIATNTALAVFACVLIVVGAAHVVAATSMSVTDARRLPRVRNAFAAGLWLAAIGIVAVFRGFPILGCVLTAGSLLASFGVSRRLLRAGRAVGAEQARAVAPPDEPNRAVAMGALTGDARKCRRCGETFGLGFGDYCMECFRVAMDRGGFCIRCHKVTNSVLPGVSAATCPSCLDELKAELKSAK
jgi:hypothetical protein